MSKPLYEGSITEVHGIRVGQRESREGLTGVTVVLCSRDGATIGADVRGAAPGTRVAARRPGRHNARLPDIPYAGSARRMSLPVR